MFYDVTQRFPEAAATLILRDHALRPADDSPFVNEVFDAAFVDAVHAMEAEARRDLIASMRNTNYAVVNHDLIERIYALLYRQRVADTERHRVLAGRSIEAVHERNGLILDLRDSVTGAVASEGFDLAILATGYRHDSHERLLAGLAADLGRFEVDRFYRLRTPPPTRRESISRAATNGATGCPIRCSRFSPSARPRSSATSYPAKRVGHWPRRADPALLL